MNAIGLALLVVVCILMLAVPRRHAALVLLLSAAYMTQGQLVEIGPAHFTFLRIVIGVGLLRVLMRSEALPDGLHTVDKLMFLWAAVLMAAGGFDISRAGIVWSELGCYLLLRTFVRNIDDIRHVFTAICIGIVPLAGLLLIEKLTQANLFAEFGGVHALAQIREGNVRAQGPFDHPIFAGAVGAAVIAIALALRHRDPSVSVVGCAAGATMVYAAASSGPYLMVAFVLLARAAWAFRNHMRGLRWLLLGALLALAAVMNDPVYFLMARVDITGGSQGYFRAQLIRSAIEHLPEWWIAGTDHTRHWMATGIHANGSGTDITNHFLAMGVAGGLPLMTVFVLIVCCSFRDVGRGWRLCDVGALDAQRFVWGLGALLFGFVMLFWSISLYDQSNVFFYLTLAAIQATVRRAHAEAPERPTFAARSV